MGEESWDRNPGKRFIRDDSWERNHRRKVMGEKAWTRNHSSGNHLGGSLEASGKHVGHPWGGLGELWETRAATRGPAAS